MATATKLTSENQKHLAIMYWLYLKLVGSETRNARGFVYKQELEEVLEKTLHYATSSAGQLAGLVGVYCAFERQNGPKGKTNNTKYNIEGDKHRSIVIKNIKTFLAEGVLAQSLENEIQSLFVKKSPISVTQIPIQTNDFSSNEMLEQKKKQVAELDEQIEKTTNELNLLLIKRDAIIEKMNLAMEALKTLSEI